MPSIDRPVTYERSPSHIFDSFKLSRVFGKTFRENLRSERRLSLFAFYCYSNKNSFVN